MRGSFVVGNNNKKKTKTRSAGSGSAVLLGSKKAGGDKADDNSGGGNAANDAVDDEFRKSLEVAVAAAAAEATDDVAVRCLRRRLWQAVCLLEDGDEAYRAYRSTRREWEEWSVRQQVDLVLGGGARGGGAGGDVVGGRKRHSNKKQQQHQQLPTSFFFQTPHGQQQQQQRQRQQLYAIEQARRQQKKNDGDSDGDSSSSSTSIGLLEVYMNPSDPFTADDCKDPLKDPYPVVEEEEEEDLDEEDDDLKPTSSTGGNNRKKRSPRGKRGEFKRTTKTSKSRNSRLAASGDDDDPTTLSHHRNPFFRLGVMGFLGRSSSLRSAAAAATGAAGAAGGAARDSPTGTNGGGADDDVDDPRATTPLHEAARLAHYPLVRCMLYGNPLLNGYGNTNGGALGAGGAANPNARNGAGRTALHLAAGGLTRDELSRIAYVDAKKRAEDENGGAAGSSTSGNLDNIGIRVPEPVVDTTIESEPSDGGGKGPLHSKAARAVGRLFHPRQSHHHQKQQDGGDDDDARMLRKPISQERWNELLANRTRTAQLLLQWSYPDDGSPFAGQGISFNAVDHAQGRTALHYAAELGRSDICQALMDMFGCLLTIVDNSGRTPCELAAAQDHAALAAMLEARALLYDDPYGMNDELLNAVSRSNIGDDLGGTSGGRRNCGGRSLVPPFSWFNTWTSLDCVQKEREKRLDTVMEKIQKIIAIDKEVKATRAFLSESSDSGDSYCSESNADDDSEDEGTGGVGNASSNGETSDDGDVDRNTQDEEGDADDDEDTKPKAVPASVSEDATASPLEQESDDKPLSPSSRGARIRKTNEEVKDLSVVFEGLNKSHIQLYLTFHRWDVRKALLAFVDDPRKAFLDANVPLPTVSMSKEGTATENSEEGKDENASDGPVCLICCETFKYDSPEWKCLSGCRHAFCKDCLGDYISDCAESNSGLTVRCPHHECNLPLSPSEVVELSPSTSAYEQLLQSENTSFVSNASDVRFCPHPDCDGMVQFITPRDVANSSLDPSLLHTVGAVCTSCKGRDNDDNDSQQPFPKEVPRTYEGMLDPHYKDCKSEIPPRKPHRFCFACGDTRMHWPVSCTKLEEWKEAIEEQVKKVRGTDDGEGGNSEENYNDIAQKLWLKTNTRPCPKVSSRQDGWSSY